MPTPDYGPLTPGIFRWSSSSLQDLLKCSQLYFLKLEHRHRVTTVRMSAGSALHAGALQDNLTKMATGEGATTSEIVDSAVACYKEEIENSEVSETPLEQAEGVDLSAKMARLYSSQVSKLVKNVVAAEEKLVAGIGEDMEIAGTLDVVTTRGVGDVKTGALAWTQARADELPQLTMYSWLHEAHFKKKPELLWIDSINNHSNRAATSRIYTTREQADYDALYRTLLNAQKMVESGIVLPAPAGAWHCSKRYCPMYNRCPYMQGRKKRD